LIAKIDHGPGERGVAEGDHHGRGERAARLADEDREQLAAIDRSSNGPSTLGTVMAW